jgi:hypothetical protein
VSNLENKGYKDKKNKCIFSLQRLKDARNKSFLEILTNQMNRKYSIYFKSQTTQEASMAVFRNI